MRYCFDTSAVNRLHSDPEREPICLGLLAHNVVYVSALNVFEVVKTTDESKRQSLLRLLKRLTVNNKPLATPNRLIRRLAVAYAARSTRVELSIGEESMGVWRVLQAPEQIDEDAVRQTLEWSEELEKDFLAAHRGGRPEFQALFEKKLAERPRTAAALIRSYLRDEGFLHYAIREPYRRATGVELARSELWPFLQTVPHWGLYCLGWVVAIYQRAIQEQNYGPRNPGNLDLWFATYLPNCDFFVTADNAQYKALRLINKFNNKSKAEVLRYRTMRDRLVI